MSASNKYKNKKSGGYDSKKEHFRAIVLRQDLKNGLITELKEGVWFELAPAVKLYGRKKPALRYKADFVYIKNGRQVVEDVKGFKTSAYIIKRHLMMSVHGIEIFET